MIVQTLINRALRLINVPGRGSVLSTTDSDNALEALQDILNSESVSRAFQPGIRRHFFLLPADTDIYSYGPGGALDTDDFEDPVPTKIEDAYIREGSTVVDNELVTAALFNTSVGWTLGGGWTIVNGVLRGETSSAVVASQSITTEVGETYDVKVTGVILSEGEVTLTLDTLDETMTTSGDFEFSYTATTTSPTFALTADSTDGFTGTIESVSVRDTTTTEKTSLTGLGSDYQVKIIDELTYNRRFSKGTGGRPYELLFSRSYPLAEIRFDNAPSSGDILVMDVTVNLIAVSSLSDTIRLHDEAHRFVRYQLAYDMAPEYGKQLSASAVRTLNRVRQQLQASNSRVNNLRVDQALRTRRPFDINRGDP